MGKSICKNKTYFILVGTLFILFVSGCGSSTANTVEEVPKTIYQKVSYTTTKVEKGDMEPSLTLTLTPDVVETIDYTVNEEKLEVDEILVSAGEKVTAGQTLVTFKAEDIRKAIDKYNDEVKKNQLLLDHYTRLANVDKKQDYHVEIEKLTDDVNLAKLYLDEEMQRLNSCSIIAEKSGTISYISKVLLDGYVAPATCMVKEICGKGTYSTETNDNYNFQIGDTFRAVSGPLECEMKVVDIVNNNENRKIIFEPSADFSDASGQDSFELTIKKSSLKNVIYVTTNAIHKKEEKEFVYVVSKDGFLDAVYIQTGEQVDDLVEVKGGLSGGEEVAVN